MWIYCTILTLFLFLEKGHQQMVKIPFNRGKSNQCSKLCYPHDCWDVYVQGLTKDGVYMIYPGGEHSSAIPVYCDMTSEGGPWTVIQKRYDGSVNFSRGWKQYENGFGRANGEFWLGLKNIHLLTIMKSYSLRINLEDFNNDARYVTYETFSTSPLAIFPEEDGYKLKIGGFQEGDDSRPAGDSLKYHNGMSFSTHDNDRDEKPNENCAAMYKGGFWYKTCHAANLNGLYLKGNTTQYATGMTWSTWTGHNYSLKKSEMKIAVKGDFACGMQQNLHYQPAR